MTFDESKMEEFKKQMDSLASMIKSMKPQIEKMEVRKGIFDDSDMEELKKKLNSLTSMVEIMKPQIEKVQMPFENMKVKKTLDDFEFEEFKPSQDSLNSMVEGIRPLIEKMQNINPMDLQAWSSRITPEVLNFASINKNELAKLSNFAKQLKGMVVPFKLSEEMQEYIREAKKSENLSEVDFEAKYGEEIEVCNTLGSKGWIVSGHATPREIQEWYNAIVKDDQSVIIQFFEEDECRILNGIIDGLEKVYSNQKNYIYYNKGIKAFREEDYMTAAMYLVAFLDERVPKLAQFPKTARYYSQKYSNEGFADIKYEKFEKTNSFFEKRFYFLDVYPSLIAYLNRLFVDGEYKFEKGIEPPYINRNWLLHGRNSRVVERFECIQVLNALDMIESVLGEEKSAK